MKTKKALKKLDKAESLLSSVIDEYDAQDKPSLREALAAAKQSVIRAKGNVDGNKVDGNKADSKPVRKPAKAAADSHGDVAVPTRKKGRVAAQA